MIQYLLLLFSFLFIGAPLCYAQTPDKKFEFSEYYGIQRENLKWTIAGNSAGQSPNIYSELKWKNNSGFAEGAYLNWHINKRISLFATLDKLEISSGKINDSDYGSDNRSNKLYDQTFDSNKGSSSLYVAGIGYDLFNTNRVRITPYAGYTISRQSLFILDNSGQFADLNSRYSTDWKGPFIKISAVIKVTNLIKLQPEIMYSQVSYNATADWNLIHTFSHPVSFRHDADGYGLNTGLQLIYNLNNNIALYTTGNYYYWQTGNGTDQLYLTSGDVNDTRLNGVNRNGFGINIGLKFFF